MAFAIATGGAEDVPVFVIVVLFDKVYRRYVSVGTGTKGGRQPVLITQMID